MGLKPLIAGMSQSSAGGAGSSSPLPINAQTGTTYTLALSDAGSLVKSANASAQTVTIPPNSSVAFPVGTQIFVEQSGAGVTSIAAGAGVTTNAPGGILSLASQYSVVALVKVATDTWLVNGATGPGPIAGTSLTITGTSGPQVIIGYDGTNNLSTSVDASGNVVINGGGGSFDWRFSHGGTVFAEFTNNALIVGGRAGAWGIAVGGGGNFAGRSRYSVDGSADSGPGISDGGAANTVGFCIGAVDYGTLTTSLLQFTVPISPKRGTLSALGSAATAGAGATAFCTDASTTLLLGLGTAITGGGSNKVPAYSDGTNWIYG